MQQVRYDEEKGIYRDCKFCGGKGCMACPGEADRAYKRAFPDGPQPIATFKLDDPEDMERLKGFTKDVVEKACADAAEREELVAKHPIPQYIYGPLTTRLGGA